MNIKKFVVKTSFNGLNKLVICFCLFLNCVISTNLHAKPSNETLQELNNSVLRVKVKLANGHLGLGSAVVISKNETVTNCHVVNNATQIDVIVNGQALKATAIKADWHHDLCLLTVENLNVPAVKLGASKSLQYHSSFFTVGYPDDTQTPVNTFGAVKSLFPMDNSVIIQASSPFKLGASGGGAFDDVGNLVGIIAVKSTGNMPNYYYLPVEWVQALMTKPAQALGAKSEKPFWAMAAIERPYFMQVVKPYIAQDWKTLLKLATFWVQAEPNTAESWFYLAAAEYANNDLDLAQTHFKKVLTLNNQHTQASEYLEKLALKLANINTPLKQVALMN